MEVGVFLFFFFPYFFSYLSIFVNSYCEFVSIEGAGSVEQKDPVFCDFQLTTDKCGKHFFNEVRIRVNSFLVLSECCWSSCLTNEYHKSNISQVFFPQTKCKVCTWRDKSRLILQNSHNSQSDLKDTTHHREPSLIQFKLIVGVSNTNCHRLLQILVNFVDGPDRPILKLINEHTLANYSCIQSGSWCRVLHWF